MGLLSKKEVQPALTSTTTTLSPEALAAVSANIRSSLIEDSTLVGDGGGAGSMGDLDTVKIIINEVLIDDNLESLSNLDDAQIETLTNAITLNDLFQNPLISTKIKAFLKLQRSKTSSPRNLLEYLFRFANGRENLDSGMGSNLAKYLKRE